MSLKTAFHNRFLFKINLLSLPVSGARLLPGIPPLPPPFPTPLPASVSRLPLYVQTALRWQEEAGYATIVAQAINTLAPRGGSGVKAGLQSISNRQPRSHNMGNPCFFCAQWDSKTG